MITIIIKTILEIINIYILIYLISFGLYEFKNNNNKSGGVVTKLLTLFAFVFSFIVVLISWFYTFEV